MGCPQKNYNLPLDKRSNKVYNNFISRGSAFYSDNPWLRKDSAGKRWAQMQVRYVTQGELLLCKRSEHTVRSLAV